MNEEAWLDQEQRSSYGRGPYYQPSHTAFLATMSFLDRLFASAMPLVPRPIVRRLSARYIAGENISEALLTGAALQRANYRVTYDILGEAVSNQAGVEATATEYEKLLQALIDQKLERNFSLKPTQMGLDVSEDYCFEMVCRIAQQALAHKAFVRFEMEGSATVDGTLRVFERLLHEKFGGTVGCVLQSMLLRTENDAARLVALDQPLNVRLVKGIYVEPKEIAHQDPTEVNAAYLRVLRVLLDGGAFVAVASHDENLIEGLQEYLQENPKAKSQVEVQMLLGVREELRQQIKASGLPVRVYVPYGTQWYPYVVRRLRKNPKLATYAFTGLFRKREKMDA
ncbi:MAG: proline dehydrogenase family protein [Planctomycetes bacterium]|nr:proline dehydrogenase family protein [Planctomycetota bacterium]